MPVRNRNSQPPTASNPPAQLEGCTRDIYRSLSGLSQSTRCSARQHATDLQQLGGVFEGPGKLRRSRTTLQGGPPAVISFGMGVFDSCDYARFLQQRGSDSRRNAMACCKPFLRDAGDSLRKQSREHPAQRQQSLTDTALCYPIRPSSFRAQFEQYDGGDLRRARPGFGRDLQPHGAPLPGGPA